MCLVLVIICESQWYRLGGPFDEKGASSTICHVLTALMWESMGRDEVFVQYDGIECLMC